MTRSSQHPSSAPPVDWPLVLSQHRRWLMTVLRARGVEKSAVEEIWQEIQTAAVAHGEQLRDPTKVAPWLYRIAVRSALQHRRRVGRRRKHLERYRETLAPQRGDPDPLDWLLADEQRQLVRAALDLLPPRDAEILLLKYTEDWSYRQLSQHLGTSLSAVESRLHRARERMRRALARRAPDLVLQETKT